MPVPPWITRWLQDQDEPIEYEPDAPRPPCSDALSRAYRPHWYILDAQHTPVPCEDMTLVGTWLADITLRRVAETVLGPSTISTVFLCLDHAIPFESGPDDAPLLFETQVFGGVLDAQIERYASWDEALAGHAAMVALVQAVLTAEADS